ncbi:ABC transporter permease [Psychromonas arctica]|uniref:ABC transporter permease n=1 Tax=Psychromonas arctica TaxID=168275 RepID=A0ABU9H858_9GAMM
MIKLVPRAQASAKWGYLSPILAVFLTLIASTILFMALGKDPVEALYTFFISPIVNWYGITELLVVAIPILLCAYGLALCYRASIWNIGAEGQLLTGAVVGTVMALQFVDSSSAWAMPLTLIAGMVGGMICSGISAFLNLRLNCNETLVTIMMNYIALNTLLWAVYGPLKDPNGYNFPESALFGDSTLLPILFEGTRLHVGLLLVVLALVVTWVFMSKTFLGFQIKVLGLDKPAAHMAGYKQKKLAAMVFLVSGALAGLAGAVIVTGSTGQLIPAISPGYGYSAIIVAFLGRLHPVGITLAGLLIALLFMGGEMSQMILNLPRSISGILQGLILFFLLSCDVLIRYRIAFTFKRSGLTATAKN